MIVSLAMVAMLAVPQLPFEPSRCIEAGPPPQVLVAECQGIPQGILDSQHIGGCSLTAVPDVDAGGSTQLGKIDIEAIVFSATPADNPVTAKITCYVLVNGHFNGRPGSVRNDVTAIGTVVVVGGALVSFESEHLFDLVQICQDIDYHADGSVETSECFMADKYEIPPPIVWEIVDPLVCPIIAMAAPGAGSMYINSQGDVWVDGEGFFDCPAYGNVRGYPPNG